MMLLRSYLENGGDAQFLQSKRTQIAAVGDVMINLMDADGLTFASPSYKIKYVMDNCEVYKGLTDLATLYDKAFHDPGAAARYRAYAEKSKRAILSELSNRDEFCVYKDLRGKIAVDWNSWYPDSTSQLFPIVYEILDPGSDRAVSLYQTFTRHFPKWSVLQSGDAFPWAVVGYSAALVGDWERVQEYSEHVQSVYAQKNHPWTWFSAESGWNIQMEREASRLPNG